MSRGETMNNERGFTLAEMLVVCAIVGATRPLRRRRAVAALCVSGLVPLLFCCAPIFGKLTF